MDTGVQNAFRIELGRLSIDAPIDASKSFLKPNGTCVVWLDEPVSQFVMALIESGVRRAVTVSTICFAQQYV
jgi:hypothetical protein